MAQAYRPSPAAEVARSLRQGLNGTYEAFLKHRLELLQEALASGKSLHALLEEVRNTATKSGNLAPELENLAEQLRVLGLVTQKKIQEGVLFSEKAARELKELFEGFSALLRDLHDLFLTGSPVLSSHILQEARNLQQVMRLFSTEHEERLIKGICLPRSSELYLAYLDAFRSLSRGLENLAGQAS